MTSEAQKLPWRKESKITKDLRGIKCSKMEFVFDKFNYRNLVYNDSREPRIICTFVPNELFGWLLEENVPLPIFLTSSILIFGLLIKILNV